MDDEISALTEACDTIDHEILLGRLQSYFGVYMVQLWSAFFSVLGRDSEPVPLSFGVPQGSVLGPVLFTKPISYLIAKHPVNSVVDDTQLNTSANFCTIDNAI